HGTRRARPGVRRLHLPAVSLTLSRDHLQRIVVSPRRARIRELPRAIAETEHLRHLKFTSIVGGPGNVVRTRIVDGDERVGGEVRIDIADEAAEMATDVLERDSKI